MPRRLRLDAGNRSFFGLVGVALVPYLLLGIVGCGLFSVLGYRLATRGLDAVVGDAALWPAIVFFAVITAGIVLTARSVRRQLRATRRLAASVHTNLVAPTPALAAGAEASRLAGRIDLVDDPAACSFTYGIAQPRVAISRGLVEIASAGELGAVLAHEAYHVRNLDPAKVVLARALATAIGLIALGSALAATVIALGGPGELMRQAMGEQMGGSRLDGLDVAGGVLCGGAWAAAGWAVWRRLAHRGG